MTKQGSPFVLTDEDRKKIYRLGKKQSDAYQGLCVCRKGTMEKKNLVGNRRIYKCSSCGEEYRLKEND